MSEIFYFSQINIIKFYINQLYFLFEGIKYEKNNLFFNYGINYSKRN